VLALTISLKKTARSVYDINKQFALNILLLGDNDLQTGGVAEAVQYNEAVDLCDNNNNDEQTKKWACFLTQKHHSPFTSTSHTLHNHIPNTICIATSHSLHHNFNYYYCCYPCYLLPFDTLGAFIGLATSFEHGISVTLVTSLSC